MHFQLDVKICQKYRTGGFKPNRHRGLMSIMLDTLHILRVSKWVHHENFEITYFKINLSQISLLHSMQLLVQEHYNVLPHSATLVKPPTEMNFLSKIKYTFLFQINIFLH
jgi:hypothetical protein